jgi:UDP-galactopyranose mutase
MMPSQYATRISGTVVTTEIPFESTHPDHHEYPFPDEKNAALYAEYRRRADALDGVVIAGRLGEYRYLDMDQAIGRALLVADRLMAL